MIINFSKFGINSIQHVHFGFVNDEPTSLNIFNIYNYSKNLLIYTNNYVSLNYYTYNAYDYIFFSLNYYHFNNSEGVWIYDNEGFLKTKLGFGIKNETFVEQRIDTIKDFLKNDISKPNLISHFNSYGTREGQMLLNYDEYGRIIEQLWDYHFNSPNKKNIYQYTSNQEYVLKIFVTDKRGEGFEISEIELFRTNLRGKIKSHHKFKTRIEYSGYIAESYNIELENYTLFEMSYNNTVSIKKYEIDQNTHLHLAEFSDKDKIKVDKWSSDDYWVFFKKAIEFVEDEESEVAEFTEILEEYDGENLFKKIIIQAGEEFIYDYKYDFDNEGDWLSKTCFCNNERIDEERRIIKYY